ncbi:hypothetical protein LSCM1_01401 [Leishmania martiniquensis]|uniref:Uncharacterized protein n=1 Tax=Leishmania martiniquensis TaxID=1580590 RepID=A0A836KFZ7_9TRYP|nr:hypothetical protein LSCM1_01401 [Leishmania martiniquensis]
MSEAAQTNEMQAEVMPVAEAPPAAAEPAITKVAGAPASTEDGITLAEAPQKPHAGQDGCAAPAAEPVPQTPPQRTIRPAVSGSHMRISSRPLAGDTHSSNAHKTTAGASAMSGRSHAVPYEGTAVHLSSRGRAPPSRPRAGASDVGAVTKTSMPPEAEEVEQAKAQAPRETAATDCAAMRAKIRSPEPYRKPARSQKAPKANAASAAANGSEGGPLKKAPRRRLADLKAAGPKAKKATRLKTDGDVAMKATKSRKTVRESRKSQSPSDKADGVESAAITQKTLKKRSAKGKATAAAKGGEAAAAKKEATKKKAVKKSCKTATAAEAMPSSDAAASHAASGEGAPHAAEARAETEERRDAAGPMPCTEDQKSTMTQHHTKDEGEIGAPAAEGDATAATKHADPEAMDAAEASTSYPKEKAADVHS